MNVPIFDTFASSKLVPCRSILSKNILPDHLSFVKTYLKYYIFAKKWTTLVLKKFRQIPLKFVTFQIELYPFCSGCVTKSPYIHKNTQRKIDTHPGHHYK